MLANKNAALFNNIENDDNNKLNRNNNSSKNSKNNNSSFLSLNTNSTTSSPSCTSSSISSSSADSTTSNFRSTYLNEINDNYNNPNRSISYIQLNNNNNNKSTRYASNKEVMENLNDSLGLTLVGNNNTAWVPPNDRELIMRARLKTGWSSRSNHIMQTNSNSPNSNNENVIIMNSNYNNNNNNNNNPLTATNNRNNAIENLIASNNNNNSLNNENKILKKSSPSSQQQMHSLVRPSISETEFQEIEQVMLRAALIEQKEADRINKLYQRYSTMNRPHGNGETSCLICNTNFGILSSSPRICSDCFKNVCSTCTVDALSSSKQTTIWLCKICAEYRDLLKKSGAWFSKRLPNNALISPSNSTNNNNTLLTNSNSKFKIANITDANNNHHTTSNDEYDADDEFNNHNRKKSNNINNNDNDMINHKQDFKENFFGEITAINKINNQSHHTVDDSKFNFELDNQLLHEQVAASRRPSKGFIELNSSQNGGLLIKQRPLTSSSDSLAKLGQEINSTNLTNKSTDQKETSPKSSAIVGSPLGSIQFSVEYIPSLLKLKINLISGANLPARDSNGLSDPYVKLHLLPGIAKATKLRSRTVYKNLNPQYNEIFYYEGVTNEDLDQKTLRLTVLDEDKFGFDFIGEYRLPLKTILRNEINHFNVPLEEKQDFGDEADTNFRGKINLAVKYSKNSNCLFVKINRCTQLIPMDNGKTSDPFVEVSLVPFSKESKQKFKTSIKWKTLDPEFIEEFKFINIDLKTLLTKTLEISVWDKDFRKNDFIGQVLLGQQRTGDELKHFFTMIKNPELYHEQWHTLHLKENGEDNTD